MGADDTLEQRQFLARQLTILYFFHLLFFFSRTVNILACACYLWCPEEIA